jgi:hypothetical protein
MFIINEGLHLKTDAKHCELEDVIVKYRRIATKTEQANERLTTKEYNFYM